MLPQFYTPACNIPQNKVGSGSRVILGLPVRGAVIGLWLSDYGHEAHLNFPSYVAATL